MERSMMAHPKFPPLLLIIPLLFSSFQQSTAESPSLDPCKRQPFRGRCPPGPNGLQTRSQFVLRYYLRNGECISYPYGHCVNDENEPRLYRYKEECEDACMAKESDGKEATYATVGPPQPAQSKDTVAPVQIEPSGDASPKEEMTECQRQRLKASGEKRIIQGGFTPECTPDGLFQPLQCESRPDGDCFCVDKEGIELKYSRAKGGQRPDCQRIASAQSSHTPECTGPADAGPCTAALPRWHFHQPSGQCKPFNFSGCGGNGNNFGSQQACSQRCLGEAKCSDGQLALKDGQGQLVDCANANCPIGFICQPNAICCPEPAKEAVQPAPVTGDAADFLFSDKKAEGTGTGNAAEGVNTGEVCSLPKDRGPCDQYQMRFYYNRELAECKYFFYGGCEGNANNFPRVEDCEKACLRGKPNLAELVTTTTTTTTIASTTQTIGQTKTASSTPSAPEPQPPIPVEPLPAPAVQPNAPAMLPVNRCQHPKDEGSCGAQFVRWFWNGEARICESFAYSGCGGNGNNFASREECLSICHREAIGNELGADPAKNVCDSDIDPGQCGGIFMRYGFDKRTAECRQFQYGGCGGNGNNFASLADCRRKCLGEPAAPLSPNICEHRIDQGECSGAFQRFGYDQDTNRCTKFVYGGCGGNGNNFATLEDCRAACVRVQCPPEPDCDLGRCQLVRDAQGCPLCSCPPPRHPPLVSGPPTEGRGQCPSLDVHLCQEPCIIFLNRRGCRECVCPIMPPTQPNAVEQPSLSGPMPPAPSDEHVSMPRQPPPAPLPQATASPPAAPAPPAPKPILGGVSNNGEVEALPPPTVPPPTSTPPPPPAPSPSPTALSHQPVAPVANAFGHNEICSQPLDTGAPACTRFVQRWFFNADSGQCEPFTYTGCAGNRNHFFSKKECQIYCARFSRKSTFSPRTAQGTTGNIATESGTAPPPPPAPLAGRPQPAPIAIAHARPMPTASDQSAQSFQQGNAVAGGPSPAPIVPHPAIRQEQRTVAPIVLQPIDPNVRLESRIVPESRVPTAIEVPAAHVAQNVVGERTEPVGNAALPQRPILRIGAVGGQQGKKELDLLHSMPAVRTEEASPAPALAPSTEAQPSSTVGTAPKARQMVVEQAGREESGNVREQEHNTIIQSIQIPVKKTSQEPAESSPSSPSSTTTRTTTEIPQISSSTAQAEVTGIERKEGSVESEEVPSGIDSTAVPSTLAASSSRHSTASSPTAAVQSTTEKAEERSPEGASAEKEEERAETTPDDLMWLQEGPKREEENIVKAHDQQEIAKASPEKQSVERVEDNGNDKVAPEAAGKEKEEGKAEEGQGKAQAAEQSQDQSAAGGEAEGSAGLSELFTSHHIRTQQGPAIGGPQQPANAEAGLTQVARQMVEVGIGEAGGEEEQQNSRVPSISRDESANSGNEAAAGEQQEGQPESTASTAPPQPQQHLVPWTESAATASTGKPIPSTALPPQVAAVAPRVPPPLPSVQHIPLPRPLGQQEICALPPDAGPCREFVPRWFFNAQNGQCEQFTFGSCHGNANNFPDRANCEALCAPSAGTQQQSAMPTSCGLEKDEGTGGGYNVHWYFNVRNLRCEQFVWQGRAGNANRFGTEAECLAACQSGATGPVEPMGLPRPRNVVPPPVQTVEVVGASFPAEDNRVEPPMMVQKGAAIAQTRDSEGVVGMPAPAEAIPDAVQPAENPSRAVPEAPAVPAQSNSYSAVPLPKLPPKMPDNLPPMLGKSPPATIDYVNGKRFDNAGDSAVVAHGLLSHVPDQQPKTIKSEDLQVSSFGSSKDGGLLSFGAKQSSSIASGVPVCPNGLNAMQYSDGRPVLCLPGMGQCPDKSVCFFNGLDFFCCPNEDDPYDQHVFGGYDGEESKHGYKVGGAHQNLRSRRQAEEQLAELSNSLRFDDKPPPAPQSQATFQQQPQTSLSSSEEQEAPTVNVCALPLQKGKCRGAILRFFYESSTGRCRPFYFTGCDGNGNNFVNSIECEKTCKGSPRLSIPQPKGPCPGGSLPLGGNNPVLCGERLDSIGCPSGFLCVPGPPSVCCPAVAEREIRRKPAIAEPDQMEVQPANMDGAKQSQTVSNIADLHAQLLLCPDGSDPMRNGSSNGVLISCGAGIEVDGQPLCEPGFYCSIDAERNVRFCCPLQAQGAKLGAGPSSAELLAPHFGRRTANPGEVMAKGSLPSDQRSIRRKAAASQPSNWLPEFGHLRLRASRMGEGKRRPIEKGEEKLMEPKGHDWPPTEDPFEGSGPCLARPDEGRQCAEGEPSPRSNLQYFYNGTERRCKVFFYRGCGGNTNRFSSKEECERRCARR